MSWYDEIKKDIALNVDFGVFCADFMYGKYNDKLHEIAPVLYNEYKNNNKTCFITFWSYATFYKGEEFKEEALKWLKQQKTE